MKHKFLTGIFIVLSVTISCKETADSNEDSDAQTTDAIEQEYTEKEKTIMFFGNSLTAGYGLEESEAFPAIIQQKLDSLELPYNVINAGNSGETTSGGLNRIDWALKQDVAIFVLELGANDGLRGIPVAESKKNLKAIINVVKKKNPNTEIILAGMQLPPNMGGTYTTSFKDMFPQIASEEDIKLIPFLLQGVGGIPRLNLPDGIHPTADGHLILAQNVWEVLEEVVTTLRVE